MYMSSLDDDVRPRYWPVKDKHGMGRWCSCGTLWCDEHNDCVWECWNIDSDSHMTKEEYQACIAQRYPSSSVSS
jgi:hypothetical protein